MKMEPRKLLKDVEFPGDSDHTYLIAVAGACRRAELVRSEGEKGRIAAVIEVQRTWRGYRTRSKLKAIFSSAGEDTSTQSSKLRGGYKTWYRRQSMCGKEPASLSFKDYCADLIQGWWRKKRRRRKSQEEPVPILTEDTAAAMIQRAWRSYSDTKVFHFYRELINFHGRGNPELMLKCINPNEAKLMDRASGGLVRFRLGGDKFPPNIYYKIFTSRPVVDMCAFSPRDYTAMSERGRLPRDVHNKEPRVLDTRTDDNGWYKRIENNGWRLVSDRLENGALQDPVTSETSAKVTTFHHLRLRRKEEVEKSRKKKRREWMTKLYSGKHLPMEAPACSEVSEGDMRPVGDSSGDGLDTTPGKEEMADVDTLLQWTSGLDYDQYMLRWRTLATSAVSDDAYSFTINRT